jgi:phosphoribosylformimino-5-aminoimidazole carboxamide ribotide isomerase
VEYSTIQDRILPVIDLKESRVVRGVAGRRAEYQPLVSPICPSSDAAELAVSFRNMLSHNCLYLADLDAISGRPGAGLEVVRQLGVLGFLVWIDAGVKSADEVRRLFAAGAERVILGSESVSGMEVVSECVRTYGPDRLVFSLDLIRSQPLGRLGTLGLTTQPAGWQPMEIVQQMIESGVSSLIVLDLADVGMGTGGSQLELLAAIRSKYPEVELIGGGGVRQAADIERAVSAGADRVLVSSWLHERSRERTIGL